MPSRLSAFGSARDGCESSELSGPATQPWWPIVAQHLEAELLGLLRRHDHARRGAVGDLRRRGRGDRAVLVERGLELAQALGGGVAADALVLGDDDRVALALRDRTPARSRRRSGRSSTASAARWCDAAENSSMSSRLRPIERREALGRGAHRLVVVDVGEAVVTRWRRGPCRRRTCSRGGPSGACTAPRSSTPCRRPRRCRSRRPGSSGRPARWRRGRTGRPC